MKSYIRIFHKTISTSFVYRSNLYMPMLAYFVFVFLQYSLWSAVFALNEPKGTTISQMMTYIFIGMMIRFLTTASASDQLSQEIREGKIELMLIRPYNLFLFFFAKQLARIVVDFISKGLPLLFISLLFLSPFIQIPYNLSNWLYFGFCCMNAVLIAFCMDYIIGLMAFWIIETWQLRFLIQDIGNVFSGVFIPLWFFSDTFLWIANLLPYPYLYFYPINVLLGNVDHASFLSLTLIGLSWSIGLVGVIMLMWHFCKSRIVIQGG
ncbi:ABC-2 family transporter protein [Paenibacillus sp. ACRRX]|uniref:ABC transporter permease n=1 Tax=unclassified Paenibacillus TaxID=185978 RepID=UPI001EF6EB84|nr:MULTISPECIES: ABC-2 family transporter protein [unclassified Paenibacillus]MCG7409140.1 ABC-2 family transporter protein [Paenibacillus sp. ACRRX]MDK8181866.1 ABC-2 family transporter protein [Paenibacillus sp. UMB4589-SE434]